jgi:Zn finger protein HypA/HybF involved in hydrogenase expression
MKTMYECKICGSNNVQIQKWIDANTNEILNDTYETENGWYYCDNCEEHEQDLIAKEVA